MVILLALTLLSAMAGDPYRMLTPGEPIDVGVGPLNLDWHNAVTRNLKDSQRLSKALTGEVQEVPADDLTRIANVEGVDIPKYGIVGVGEVCILNQSHRIYYSAPPYPGQPFAVTLEPIPAAPYFCSLASSNLGHQPPDWTWWGRVEGSIVPAAWSTGTDYVRGNLVVNDGVAYFCLLANSATEPPNSTYWLPLTLGVSNQRGYRSGITYPLGALVIMPNVGKVKVGGEARCVVDMADARHQFAAPIDGDYDKLASQVEEGPARIIRTQYGTGETTTLIMFCCEPGELPTFTGEGELSLGIPTMAGTGDYLYTPGGALYTGAATMAGTGAYTAPAYTGSGTLATVAATISNTGNFYPPPPSGALYTEAAVMVGVGVATGPPTGFGALQPSAATMAGTGTITVTTQPAAIGTARRSFTAQITGVAADSSGRLNYAWTEQVMNETTGNYGAGTRSGTTAAGPWMREINNHLVNVPSLVHAFYRGTPTVDSVPIYEFDRCYTITDTVYGAGALSLGAATMSGTGTIGVNGSGALATSAATMAGTGGAGVETTFNASGTWTATSTSALVKCYGPGAAGAGGANGVRGGGGGGGGAYAEKLVTGLTIGNNYTVHVGTGAGDDTYFIDAATVMAKAGVAGSGATGGAGGSAASSVGTTTYDGGTGGDGEAGAGNVGGGGGGGGATSAGAGTNGTNGAGGLGGAAGAFGGGAGGDATLAGADGTQPGGAGGGGGADALTGGAKGNPGAGRVIVDPQ